MANTNMTVEDRLAEKLKSAEFAQWFGEDDLRDLRDDAITEAARIAYEHHVQWADRRDRSARGSKDWVEADCACQAVAHVWREIGGLLPGEATNERSPTQSEPEK